jgi:hypothetical protein
VKEEKASAIEYSDRAQAHYDAIKKRRKKKTALKT